MILIDREKETGWLKEAYSRRNAELGVIYGRRRLGKTFLIKTFVADKPHFYFLAKQQDMGLELGRFKDKIGKKFNVFLEAKDLEGLFEEIKTKIAANHKKLIVVIDEFPYWVNKEQAIPSEFQSIWDEILKDSNVMLVLLGSYISVMEQKVIGYKSPLYGRRTFQILLQKLPIRCLKEFFPRYTEEELIKMYGCADTIPYYLALLEKNKSFKDNLMGFFNASSPLYSDAEIILSSELREYNTYLNIMKAILDGATRLNEIAAKSKVEVTNILKYLNVLIAMRLIRKTKPVTDSAKEKNYIYEIEDNYFRFWLKYIYPYKEEIEEFPEKHLQFVMGDYNAYMGKVFENFCMDAAPEFFDFTRIGRWWHKEREIDIVALDEKKQQITFCECKWQDKADAAKLIEELKEKANYVEWNREKRKEQYVVFAKSFKKKIKAENVRCIDMKDLAKVFRKS